MVFGSWFTTSCEHHMWSAWKSNTGSCGVPHTSHTMNACCGATLRNLDGTSRAPKPRPLRSAEQPWGIMHYRQQFSDTTDFLDSPKDGSLMFCWDLFDVPPKDVGCRKSDLQWKTHSPLLRAGSPCFSTTTVMQWQKKNSVYIIIYIYA